MNGECVPCIIDRKESSVFTDMMAVEWTEEVFMKKLLQLNTIYECKQTNWVKLI